MCSGGLRCDEAAEVVLTGFRRFARVTLAHATLLGTVEADAVREAWAEVGIVLPATAAPPLTMTAGAGAPRA